MKPVIGICANDSIGEPIGLKTGYGLPGQEWQVLEDDYIKAIERAEGTPVILPITESVESLIPVLGKLDASGNHV